LKILMIGDTVGSPGRKAVARLLPELRQEYSLDMVMVNGENAAGGFGLTLDTAEDLFEAGVDVITSGNHIWDKKEIFPHLDGKLPIIRPMNYPAGVPGQGAVRHKGAIVMNLIGRVFVGNFECPFRQADSFLEGLENDAPRIIIVDFHAEATSEKVALGLYLDGRVSAVLGTHTHVPTADHRILPNGTAFVSDVGMVGVLNSVIGSNPDDVMVRFLTSLPHRLNVAKGSTVQFNSVLLDIDDQTGRSRSIERIDRVSEE
jgi:metallophosphoesterase (TIGR00282 family)